MQSTVRRIASERSIKYVPEMLYLHFRMPHLGYKDELATLKKALVKYGVEVVIFDPLYLALTGSGDTNHANLHSIGPLILNAAKVCLRAGATSIFLHHTTNLARIDAPVATDRLIAAGNRQPMLRASQLRSHLIRQAAVRNAATRFPGRRTRAVTWKLMPGGSFETYASDSR